MLNFKNVNYIIGNKSDIQSGFSKIMSFYDAVGFNMLLLYHESNDSGISSWIRTSHKKFSKIDSDILQENLFKVDYLVVDVYLSATFLNLKQLELKIRETTDIPIIFIVYVDAKIDLDESYKMSFINKFKNRTDITIHKISRLVIPSGSVLPIDDSSIIISNILEKWTTSLKELKLKYIRNKKLEDIFKEDE